MSVDKTVERFNQRFKRPTGGRKDKKERIPRPLIGQSDKPERARQSLHFANQSFKDLDDAYRKAAHDVYPAKLNKANFVEALVSYGLEHVDEVVALALEQQQAEEEEE